MSATKDEEKKTVNTVSKHRQQGDELKATYATEQDSLAEKDKNELNTQLDQQQAKAERDVATQRAKVEDDYRSVIDTVAVQRELDRRQISETMANLGLSRSGLNATQQTAVQLSAGNKTAAAQRQRQAAIDTLTQSLADYRMQIENDRREGLNAIDRTREENVAAYNQKIEKAVTEAEQNDAKLAQEAEKAAAEQALAIAKQQHEANKAGLDQLLKNGNINGAVYAQAVGSGISVQELVKQGLVKATGTYTQNAPRSTPTANQKALTALHEAGSITPEEYYLAYASDTPVSQVLQTQEQTADPKMEKEWSWSTTAYRKTGKDTNNWGKFLGLFGDAGIDEDDYVEYYDSNGDKKVITLKALYDNIVAEGTMTPNEAKDFVSKFNSADNTNKYFLSNNAAAQEIREDILTTLSTTEYVSTAKKEEWVTDIYSASISANEKRVLYELAGITDEDIQNFVMKYK